MYPIQTIIRATIAERAIKRGHSPELLGYQNASTALRHLHQIKAGGQTTPDFNKRLSTALKIDPIEFEAVI